VNTFSNQSVNQSEKCLGGFHNIVASSSSNNTSTYKAHNVSRNAECEAVSQSLGG